MTAEQWVTIIVALGGGAGIAAVIRPAIDWARGPRPSKRSTSAPPPPPQHHVTKDDLSALREEIREVRDLIESVEDGLRSRLDERVRELVDRLHALAIKVEAVVAARAAEERLAAPSRRGGGR